jgi:hypothetical protein
MFVSFIMTDPSWGYMDMCRQLACFCATSDGASVCLRAQIPIGSTLDRCQTLQSETEAALSLNDSFDEALGAVLDIRALLEVACSSPEEAGSRVVLRAVQLVAIARTLKGLMALRSALLPGNGAPQVKKRV